VPRTYHNATAHADSYEPLSVTALQKKRQTHTTLTLRLFCMDDFIYNLMNQTYLDAIQADFDTMRQPAAKTVTVGHEFDLTIEVQADTPLDTIGAALIFDPTHLQVIKIIAGETLDFVARNTFDNHSGQINLDAAKLGTPTEGTFAFATIRFRALASTSSTSITFGPTTDALRTANSLLGNSSEALLTVNEPYSHGTSTATGTPTPTSTQNAARETLYLPIIRR